MRIVATLILAAAIATPATAQPAPESIVIPPELTDPAMADRLGNVMHGLTGALLNLPVGEVQAALEGRPATPVDKRTTVGDLGRREDPNFDRRLHEQIAGGRETMRAGMRAMSTALPAMVRGMGEARRAMEEAIANMPSPGYPAR